MGQSASIHMPLSFIAGQIPKKVSGVGDDNTLYCTIVMDV